MQIERPGSLLEHVIEEYYPELSHLKTQSERFIQFYVTLVQRTAKLVAQWMSVGFCHAVLNTDNMSITGESFDYGPFAYIPTFDPNFTAAYFDHYGRYSYGNQPGICHWNLEMLQRPLSSIIPLEAMQAALEDYAEAYYEAYRRRMRLKLGFPEQTQGDAESLLGETLKLLETTQVGYSEFFAELRQSFSHLWWTDPAHILAESNLFQPEPHPLLETWRNLYHRVLKQFSASEDEAIANSPQPNDSGQPLSIAQRLATFNPMTVPLRPLIESVWAPISEADDWQPLYDLLHKIQTRQ